MARMRCARCLGDGCSQCGFTGSLDVGSSGRGGCGGFILVGVISLLVGGFFAVRSISIDPEARGSFEEVEQAEYIRDPGDEVRTGECVQATYSLSPTPCSEPHLFQVVAMFSMESESGDFPGNFRIGLFLEESCNQALEDTASRPDIGVLPFGFDTQEAWEDGLRNVRCLAYKGQLGEFKEPAPWTGSIE